MYGFRISFAIASSGAIISSILLILFRKLLDNVKEILIINKKKLLHILYIFGIIIISILCLLNEKIVLLHLPLIITSILLLFIVKLSKSKQLTRTHLYSLSIYLLSIILFFSVEDQFCSSILLFSERKINRNILGFTVPSSFILGVNPIIILLFGPSLTKKSFSMLTPFLLTSLSFIFLTAFCFFNYFRSLLSIVSVISIITFAELMICPLILSRVSTLAKNNSGVIMGMVSLAFSLSFQLSGKISEIFAIEQHSVILKNY